MPKTVPPPTKFKIGSVEMDITYDWAEIAKAAEETGGRTLLGLSDYQNGKFIMRPGLYPATNRDTLLHEALHLVFAHGSLRDMLAEGAAGEEQFIMRIVPVMLSMMRDNQELMRYLLA